MSKNKGIVSEGKISIEGEIKYMMIYSDGSFEFIRRAEGRGAGSNGFLSSKYILKSNEFVRISNYTPVEDFELKKRLEQII
jgi:hypothetical protein